MTSLLTDPPPAADVVAFEPPAGHERSGRWSLAVVVALAFALSAWALSGNGLGNTYYSAAVRAMASSWHDFFFASFDPGGYISVDKPPVALWVGALSVRVFGYSSWSLLLPSAVAGAAAVGVLWCTVRRRFGVAAATVAGLVLALSPVNVSVNRLNLPEPFVILFLVLAAWAVLRALDSRRALRWMVLAGAFVGLGFNTKMLAALIVTPALALAVAVGTSGWGPRLRRVIVLAGSSLAFCLPWMVAVDLWPSSSRPYVGGSTDNTVRDLVFGYNGLGRVSGQGQFGGGPAGGGPAGGVGGIGGPGGVFGGPPGWLRMFSDAVGGQIAWLLPAAAVGAGLAVWVWRRDRVRLGAVALFAGWLALYGVIFSRAEGIFHSYYTSVMAPAVGALVGIGGAAVLRASNRRVAALVASGGVLATAGVQWTVARRTPDFHHWARDLLVVLVVAGVAVLVVAALRLRWRRVAAAGLALSLAGLLVVPGAWAASEATNPTLNATLPQAGPRGGAAGGTFGSVGFGGFGGSSGTDDDALAAWLTDQRDGERWDLVTTSAMGAATLEADQGLSVMALGGFLGSDPATTPERFAAQVDAGEVRFVLAGPGRFPGSGGGLPGAGAADAAAPDAASGGAPARSAGGFPGTPPGGSGSGGFPGLPPGGSGSGGFPGMPPGGGGTFPGGLGGFGPGGAGGPFGGGTAFQVISLAQEVCTPVSSTTSPGFPAGYDGQILDCAGKGAELAAAEAST